MKELVLKIDDAKYDFFVELIKNFKFVSIDNSPSEKQSDLKNIAEGIYFARLAAQQKSESRSAKLFLNEL